ncbi:hypothetical protein ACEPAF_8020 [Sanghuangporus sanghuang]
MERARSWSQQPNSGPSRRVKPRTRRTSFPEGVIEVTDSEDEQPNEPRPAKLQKIAHIFSTETIDLTGHPPKHFDDEETTKAPLDDKGKEKAFTDLTNDQDIQRYHASPTRLGSPASEEVVKEAPIDLYLSQVLEVIPDVQPDHARALLFQYYPSYRTDVVAAVLHCLFEQPYPRIERNKCKRKREDDGSVDETGSAALKNYGSRDRPFEGGEHYAEIALNQLMTDFPRIPLPHIRQTLHTNNFLFAPTHLALREQLTWNPPPFALKKTSSKLSGKGKFHDAEFEREHTWLVEALKDKATKDHSPSNGEGESDGICGDGIECGCCFDTYDFDKMVQCPDAHLFCKGCITSYAENQLGQHNPNIVCMDQSGCKLAFTDAELKRFLPAKLLELYERFKQAKEIEAAELDGLEECPFCEYKAVIDNPDEKLFRCEREDCGAVSCRACKKADHLPKSCKEAEEDTGLNARHKVEEAMTEALMRNCPRCKKAFIKESGCNKMTCPNCHTLSCYICRQIIKGYDHFDQRHPANMNGQPSTSKQKCQLWDPVEQRHNQEVAAARERAIKEVENANPEIDKNQLEVELPKAVPAANNARVGQVPLERVGRLDQLRNLIQRMPGAAVAVGGVAELRPEGAMLMPQPPGALHPDLHQGAQKIPGRGLMPRVLRDRIREAQEARRAAIAAQRETTLQRNEEARRRVMERQERVRRQFEAQRQQAQARHEQDHRLELALQVQPHHRFEGRQQQQTPAQGHAPQQYQCQTQETLARMQAVDMTLDRIRADGARAAAQQPALAPCEHCGQIHALDHLVQGRAPTLGVPPPLMAAPHFPVELYYGQMVHASLPVPVVPSTYGLLPGPMLPPGTNVQHHFFAPVLGPIPVLQMHVPQASGLATAPARVEHDGQ